MIVSVLSIANAGRLTMWLWIRAVLFAVLLMVMYFVTLETAGWYYVDKTAYMLARAGLLVSVVLFLCNFFHGLHKLKDKKQMKQKAVADAKEESPAVAVVSNKRGLPVTSVGVEPMSQVVADEVPVVDEAEILASCEAILAQDEAVEVAPIEAVASVEPEPLASPELVASFDAFCASTEVLSPTEPEAVQPQAAPRTEKKERKFGRTVLVGAKGQYVLSFDRRAGVSYLSEMDPVSKSVSRDRIYLHQVDSKDRAAVQAAAAAFIN